MILETELSVVNLVLQVCINKSNQIIKSPLRIHILSYLIRLGWTKTGAMHHTRDMYAASVLKNGKVLVTGGDNRVDIHISAELYNPFTKNWTMTANMNYARIGHTASILEDGKVLVVGGYDDARSTELYDPLGETWTTTGRIHYARFAHTASVLRNGKVLVTGGDNLQNTAELYDPVTRAWVITGNMSSPRS